MRFFYQYPDAHGTHGDLLDAGPVAEVARTAEAAGWAGFAFTEHPVPSARWLNSGGHQTLDPFVALGHAGALTTPISLLTYLAVAPYRNPFLLAKAAATVDKLSGGRLILGLGTGYQKSEFAALGVDFEERNALFDEVLDALALHWGGQPFSYQGRHFTARDVIALPRPAQDPIPVWIGGNSHVTTARTPAIGGLRELAAAIAAIRSAASVRRVPIDVLYPCVDSTIASPDVDTDRHHEAFAQLERAVVTCVMVAGVTRTPEATTGFLQAFGDSYPTTT